MLTQIERVAATDATVLILGETGTGKELVARAVHELSRRKDHALVKVNCAALPASLIESELFGHEKGAFTGAVSQKAGRFELADGGTIFLDEIGELPVELQVKLLRVLQEHQFDRVGSNKARSVDVRVIAATNRDLEKLISAGAFRSDLFYRLNVFPIVVPPLRDRLEDIPELAWHFIEKHNAKLGRSIESIAPESLKALQSYSWPGNVRELENVIEREMIWSTGSRLELGDWFSHRNELLEQAEPKSGPLSMGVGAHGTAPTDLRTAERDHILNALTRVGWRIEGQNGAASALGIAPSTLRSKMRRLGILRPE